MILTEEVVIKEEFRNVVSFVAWDVVERCHRLGRRGISERLSS